MSRLAVALAAVALVLAGCGAQQGSGRGSGATERETGAPAPLVASDRATDIEPGMYVGDMHCVDELRQGGHIVDSYTLDMSQTIIIDENGAPTSFAVHGGEVSFGGVTYLTLNPQIEFTGNGYLDTTELFGMINGGPVEGTVRLTVHRLDVQTVEVVFRLLLTGDGLMETAECQGDLARGARPEPEESAPPPAAEPPPLEPDDVSLLPEGYVQPSPDDFAEVCWWNDYGSLQALIIYHEDVARDGLPYNTIQDFAWRARQECLDEGENPNVCGDIYSCMITIANAVYYQ